MVSAAGAEEEPKTKRRANDSFLHTMRASHLSLERTFFGARTRTKRRWRMNPDRGFAFSYLCRRRRSSPSPRWSGSGTRRGRSWAPGPPEAGCGRWSGPDTSRAARWAAPTAPPSGLEVKSRQTVTLGNLSGRVDVQQTGRFTSHRC